MLPPYEIIAFTAKMGFKALIAIAGCSVAKSLLEDTKDIRLDLLGFLEPLE